MKKKLEGPITNKQRDFLKQHGIKIWKGMTKQEAHEKISAKIYELNNFVGHWEAEFGPSCIMGAEDNTDTFEEDYSW